MVTFETDQYPPPIPDKTKPAEKIKCRILELRAIGLAVVQNAENPESVRNLASLIADNANWLEEIVKEL